MSGKIEDKNGKLLPIAYIHSALDDYGLDPYEFRVYFRIVRRSNVNAKNESVCNESIAKMAEGCQMGVSKVKECIRTLLNYGLIKRISNPGMPSDYKITDADEWNRKKSPNSTRSKNQKGKGGSSDNPGYETTQVTTKPNYLGCDMATPGLSGGYKGDKAKGDENKEIYASLTPSLTPSLTAPVPATQEEEKTESTTVENEGSLNTRNEPDRDPPSGESEQDDRFREVEVITSTDNNNSLAERPMSVEELLGCIRRSFDEVSMVTEDEIDDIERKIVETISPEECCRWAWSESKIFENFVFHPSVETFFEYDRIPLLRRKSIAARGGNVKKLLDDAFQKLIGLYSLVGVAA